LALEFLDGGRETLGQRDATAAEPNQRYAFQPLVTLHDLVGDAADGAADVVGGKDYAVVQPALSPSGEGQADTRSRAWLVVTRAYVKSVSFAASQDRLKGVLAFRLSRTTG
jgi:hypothetical protein